MPGRLESVDEYLARKQHRGVLGVPKPNPWKGLQVLTGYCPCPDCGHEVMLECDAAYADCQCCDEVCS